MSNSSILGGTRPPQQPSGTGVDALGPSDSSDSGSDVQGERPMATEPDNAGEWGALPAESGSDTDSMGTGERAAAAGSEIRDGADILPDHRVGGSRPTLTEADLEALSIEAADDAEDEETNEDDDPVG